MKPKAKRIPRLTADGFANPAWLWRKAMLVVKVPRKSR